MKYVVNLANVNGYIVVNMDILKYVDHVFGIGYVAVISEIQNGGVHDQWMEQQIISWICMRKHKCIVQQ